MCARRLHDGVEYGAHATMLHKKPCIERASVTDVEQNARDRNEKGRGRGRGMVTEEAMGCVYMLEKSLETVGRPTDPD